MRVIADLTIMINTAALQQSAELLPIGTNAEQRLRKCEWRQRFETVAGER